MLETILITGVSGYIGAHIAQVFLHAGYNVRGTVHFLSSAPSIQARYPGFEDNLTFAVVPDVEASDAFSLAVKDVVGVIHAASPFSLSVTDNEKELLLPAIRGTTNMLDSVANHGSSVRRVVFTSSFAAMVDLSLGYRPGYRYTEKDWNPTTYEVAKETSNGGMAYCASKAFAEKALWEWVETHWPGFSVVALNPAWVFGPGLDARRLNESLENIQRLVNGSLEDVPPDDFVGWVDVRDVAYAHLQAFRVPEAKNQRFLLAGGQWHYQEVVDLIRREMPELKDKVPVGTPGVLTEAYITDGSHAKEVLGLEYRSLKSTVVETVEWLVENGHVG